MSEHWRVGKSLGRTIYRHQGDDPDGTVVGIMTGEDGEARQLAQRVCDAMNGAPQATVDRIQALYKRWLRNDLEPQTVALLEDLTHALYTEEVSGNPLCLCDDEDPYDDDEEEPGRTVHDVPTGGLL